MNDDLLTLRTTRPADAQAISTMLTASYGALLAKDYAPATLAAALPMIGKAKPELMTSGTYYAVVAGDGVVIAAGGWTWKGPLGGVGPRDLAHMRHVAVHPEYTRRGFGRHIVAHTLDMAWKAGVRRLVCCSTLTAEPFYTRFGFRRTGTVALNLAPGLAFPAVEMALTLTA